MWLKKINDLNIELSCFVFFGFFCCVCDMYCSLERNVVFKKGGSFISKIKVEYVLELYSIRFSTEKAL